MWLVAVSAFGAENLVKPQQGNIVPDRFLRSWDAVTLFFNHKVGPLNGGAEDHPGKYVHMTPAHPGAFTWLDAQTLQFRPAEPWPPLVRYRWRLKGAWVGAKDHTLETLMSAPLETIPADGQDGLQAVHNIVLYFQDPVDLDALAKTVRVELRNLPGIDPGNARWLDAKDFSIKALERKNRGDKAGYILQLHQAIANGLHVTVHFRLALSTSSDKAFYQVQFTTKSPLRITHAGCPGKHVPVSETGVRYAADQALRCNGDNRQVEVVFSAPLEEMGPIASRNLLRFTPAVEDIEFSTRGTSLIAQGRFETGTVYQLHLQPPTQKGMFPRDKQGNSLQMAKSSQIYLYFPVLKPFMDWQVSHGLMEQYGPQTLPVNGRGYRKVDVRLYPIDPLDRNFWPFGDKPVNVDESKRPPSPGEEPADYKRLLYISAGQLAQRIKALGSPSVSTIVNLPLPVKSAAARFGLDMGSLFRRINRHNSPGTYLVGMRQLNKSNERAWVRIQVSDLSLTTVDEWQGVNFFVTSLKTGLPVVDANIALHGYRSQDNDWMTLTEGRTDRNGRYLWKTAKYEKDFLVQRVVVNNGKDYLVIQPQTLKEYYQNNHWYSDSEDWFGRSRLFQKNNDSARVCHLFTERPVYRPDHAVHIKGYVRDIESGNMHIVKGPAVLVVQGSEAIEWRYKLQLSEQGSFYQKFDEQKLPTGKYSAHLEIEKSNCGFTQFSKEAYKVPKFEVQLHADKTVRLDEAFDVKLTADYYAGGKVADRPVRWRVTQFPLTWSPKKMEGFAYSTDGRYSGEQRFRGRPAMSQTVQTDAFGAASIQIDPSTEPTAQPRRYVVEATVTGADDQTVTDTIGVRALPPFALAVKVPRYIEQARQITPQVIVVDAEGKFMAGQKVTLRLLQRQWHSHLQAGDFSQGVAKYVTEVVDNKLKEISFISSDKVHLEKLPIDEAGVYIVEVEASDQLGRSQRVVVDLFAGGQKAVTWSKPPANVFKSTADKDNYKPGDKAVLVLESPFQNARALAVVEEPDGHNSYQWVKVYNGKATFSLTIKKNYVPRIPVHFILMRPRTLSQPKGPIDLGKPTTIASTAWLQVKPLQHRLTVDMAYPDKAQPGDDVALRLSIKDYLGKPVGGEVTLWLVDQAVLALGKEQALDPLPDFIVDRQSQVNIRDTRRQVIGYIPFQENPGGDGGFGASAMAGLLDNVTIRRNFNPVPFYQPSIMVPASGSLTVPIKLPDNLTNFKIRAIAVSGSDKFGFAKGRISVRLPVIVQPGLPRFVRPGDSFTALGIARVVEGDGGPGRASVKVSGLELEDGADRTIELQPGHPRRIAYAMQVPDPRFDGEGRLKHAEVRVTMAVERVKDKARDAFDVSLPVRMDRKQVTKGVMKTIAAGQQVRFPAITVETRPQSLQRQLLLSAQPGVLNMAAGLNYLLAYPHGCTEQRISQARGFIAAKLFRDTLYRQSDQRLAAVVAQTQQWVGQALSEKGQLAYWPGSEGYVSLTAWAVHFMVEAKHAGLQVDTPLFKKLKSALRHALRSDYNQFIDGESYNERVWALSALAAAGELDSAYAAELARRTEYLNVESIAMVNRALSSSVTDDKAKGVVAELNKKLWQGLVIQMHQGKDRYAGLQSTQMGNPLLLASEVRSLAQVIHTFSVTEPSADQRIAMLVDGLVRLGRNDGWGSTQNNAAAMTALSVFAAHYPVSNTSLELDSQGTTKALSLSTVLTKQSIPHGEEIVVRNVSDKSVRISQTVRYLPAQDGSMTPARAAGFVVKRGMQKWVLQDGAYTLKENLSVDNPGVEIGLKIGDVLEEHIELVNAADRTFVAVVVPLAAGTEPLNPALETAPPEAKPQGMLTRSPSYKAFMDDYVAFYFNQLPKGNYHFYFRSKATVAGKFILPAAYAEKMYDQDVNGNSAGARIRIDQAPLQ